MTNDTVPASRPVRILLRRKPGWRKPPNTISIGRGTRWGSRFKIGEVQDGILTVDNEHAVRRFRESLNMIDGKVTGFLKGPVEIEEVRRQLRGRNLACWCPPGKPCHADVLFELANHELGGA